jgi:TolB protein
VICAGYFDGSTVGNLFPLTTGASPVWSPDGVKIAFHRASDGPSFGIYLINADGTGEQRIADGQQPAWSPEGSKIAFTSSDGISVMNEEGTGVATLIGPDAFVGFSVHAPAWSPDGQQIA